MSAFSFPARLRPLLMVAGLGVALLATAHGQAQRNWTDTKGRTVSAAYVRQDSTTVWIKRADGSEVAVPKSTLSAADLAFLATNPAGTTAGADFNSLKVDPASFKPVAGGFSLESISFANALESEHFIAAATGKVKPAVVVAYLDAAERVYADLNKDLPSVGKSFGAAKFLIVLADGEAEAKALNSWHSKYAAANSIRHYDLLNGNIVGFEMTKEFATQHRVCIAARIYRTDAKIAKNLNRMWPQRIHFYTEDLLLQAGGFPLRRRGEPDLDVFYLVFSFQREFTICGKIETEVRTNGGGTEVEEFRNGKGWAAATKKLIKNGSQPDIEAFLSLSTGNAAPRDLGMGYGMAQWIRKNPKLLAGLDGLIAHTAEAQKYPTAKEFATALGFESPELLNVAWFNYLASDAFQ